MACAFDHRSRRTDIKAVWVFAPLVLLWSLCIDGCTGNFSRYSTSLSDEHLQSMLHEEFPVGTPRSQIISRMKSHDVEVHDEDPGSASAVLYEPWWTPSLGMYIRVVRFYFDDRDLLRCFDESGGTRDAAPKWTTCD